MNLCECGCKQEVKIGNRFVYNHHRRGLSHSEETRRKISKLVKGRTLSQETKRKISQGNMGRIPSEETRRKLSESNKGKLSKIKGRAFSEEHKRKISESNKGKIRSKEMLKKMSEIMKGRHPSEEAKQKNRQSQLGRKHTEKSKQKMSEIRKELWKDFEYTKKIHQGLNLRPNRPETMLLNLLNKLYPNEWIYTGDFSFIINGKNPDFTNVNGKKKLIELFGDYWHEGENPQDRIDVFKPFGWDTLIIWECELKDIHKVELKLNDFLNKEGIRHARNFALLRRSVVRYLFV